ncbi:MAG: hypothetical protein M3Z01_03505 [Thermoproteota archaeon]|nr:hypothetical protein [Thermoproteota archaeon]
MLENILMYFVVDIIRQIGNQDPDQTQQAINIIDIFDYGSGIFAAVLFVLSLIAYRNAKTTRLLFVSAAFALFSLRTIIARLDFIIPETQTTTIEIALSLSGFVILALFFVAIFKK